LERGLKPLSNGCLGIIIKIILTTNYQLLLNSNKVHRALPDGASIQSSHTCDLDFPQLPDDTIKAHVITGLATSLLLSVGQIVDFNCSVILEKDES
jgi:hypothetical protein